MKLNHTLAASIAALTILATAGSAFAAQGVALEDADVYEEADDDSDVVDDLEKGEFIEIYNCKGGDYCLIQSEDGKGYVAVPYLALVEDDDEDEDDGDDEDEEEDDDY